MIGRIHNLKDLKDPLDTHCEPSALYCWILEIRHCQPERTQGFAADLVYVKGEVFAYVGLPQNLKDQKEPKD